MMVVSSSLQDCSESIFCCKHEGRQKLYREIVTKYNFLCMLLREMNAVLINVYLAKVLHIQSYLVGEASVIDF